LHNVPAEMPSGRDTSPKKKISARVECGGDSWRVWCHDSEMATIELSVEVARPSAEAAARLEAAGYELFRSSLGWRVVFVTYLIGTDSMRSHAHLVARELIDTFGLTALTEPPTVSLHDLDGDLDLKVGSLVIEDARRASDPDPIRLLTRKERKLTRHPGVK
jgi:hypothetical protein